MAATALIVQNKGGGHGEIGYHLALNLKNRGIAVTMINDSAAKQATPPFDSYGDLQAAGVNVIWADLSNGGLPGAMAQVQPCDYIFDNQNICPKDVQATVKAWNPKVYAYVSSGGMYVPTEGPLWEGGAVKEDNKQLSIERNAAANGLNWCAFRPQYIYGPKTNKRDYLDWFFDRINAGVEFPLPGNGSYRTTVTNARDVAGMMASVVDKPSEVGGQVFNCANDQLLSHIEIVEHVAQAMGKNPTEVKQKIVFYDPASLKGHDLPKKGKFPFRENTFGVAVEKAKSTLGWAPEHYLLGDIQAYYNEYVRLGKNTAPLVNEWDQAVIAIARPDQ